MLSTAAAIVLHEPRLAAPAEVLTAAVKELIAVGAWRLEGGRLARGDVPVPQTTPLPLVHRRLGGAPPDLRAAAKRLGRDGVGKLAIREITDELVQGGLLTREERRRLRVFKTTRYVRTPAGDQALTGFVDAQAAAGRSTAMKARALGVFELDELFEEIGDLGDLGGDVDFDSAFESGYEAGEDESGGGDDGDGGGDGGDGGDGGGGGD